MVSKVIAMKQAMCLLLTVVIITLKQNVIM